MGIVTDLPGYDGAIHMYQSSFIVFLGQNGSYTLNYHVT